MAGRNDRRRAANLRSSRSGGTRQGQETRSAGTSRPVDGARSQQRGTRPADGAAAQRTTRSSRPTNTAQARTSRKQKLASLPEIGLVGNGANASDSRAQDRAAQDDARQAAERQVPKRTTDKRNAGKTQRGAGEMANATARKGGKASRTRATKTQAGSNQAGSKVGEKAGAKASEKSSSAVSSKVRARKTAKAGGKATSGKPKNDDAQDETSEEFVSTSVGELRRAERRERAKKSSRKRLMTIVSIIGVVVVLLAGWAALYNSPAFTIENVEVTGVEHLTSEEMAALANVPTDTTLLRVDTGTIKRRVEQNAWVDEANIELVFPNTLKINVTERSVFAVVEIPTTGATAVKQWAISDDHIWLMPIPDAGSEAAKTTSSKVYEDAQNVLHIIDVPIGTKAEIGSVCTDSNINNALDIIAGLTTELASRIVAVSAAGTAETTLILDNGVEIAFGQAEDIRDKERVVLEILNEHPNNVAYINVRMVETPTWRAV